MPSPDAALEPACDRTPTRPEQPIIGFRYIFEPGDETDDTLADMFELLAKIRRSRRRLVVTVESADLPPDRGARLLR